MRGQCIPSRGFLYVDACLGADVMHFSTHFGGDVSEAVGIFGAYSVGVWFTLHEYWILGAHTRHLHVDYCRFSPLVPGPTRILGGTRSISTRRFLNQRPNGEASPATMCTAASTSPWEVGGFTELNTMCALFGVTSTSRSVGSTASRRDLDVLARNWQTWSCGQGRGRTGLRGSDGSSAFGNSSTIR